MAVNTEYIIRLRDKFSAQVKGAQKEADRLNSKVRKTQGAFSGLGSTLARIGAITAVGFAAKQVATLGIEMEQTRVAFATFLGDGEKANKLIEQLNEFANITPFNNAEIIKSGRLLLSAGIPAEQITEQLKSIGDVAAGANVPIAELAAIFQKATNKGKLQAEELNQFSERGIPLLDELSKKFGVSKEEVLKLGSQGKITSAVMNEAFSNMTSEGGIFFNLMEKQSQTVGGRISTLVGKLQTIGIAIGEALLPAIGMFVDFGLSIIEGGDALADLLTVLAAITAAYIGFNAVTIAASVATSIMTAKQWLLNLALNANPIGLIVAGLALFTAALVIAWRHSETFRGVILGLWDAFKSVFRNIGELALNVLGSIGDLLIGVFTFDKEKILSGISGLGSAFSNFGGQVALDFSKGFAKGVELEPGETEAGAAGSLTGQSSGATLGGVTPATGKGKLKTGISEVKAGAPKTFNINIEKLIESFDINTTNLTESATRIKQEVEKALLIAVTDASIISE